MKLAAFVAALALTLAAARVEARCYETSTSRAVGRRRCGSFGGAWNVDSTAFRVLYPEVWMGFIVHSVDLAGRTVSLCMRAGRACPITGSDRVGADAGSVAVYSFALGYSILGFGPLRWGVGFDLGSGGWSASLASARSATLGSPFITYLYTSLGAVTGAGRWTVGGELRVGASLLSIPVQGIAGVDAAIDTAFSLRAAANVQFFVHPYVAVGVYAGLDVIARDDLFAGASLRWTFMHPYGGSHD